MHVTQRIRRNGQPPDAPLPEFEGGPLAGRYKKEVVQGPAGVGWWTVRLEPIADAFQGRLTGGAQKGSGRSLARIRLGADGEVPPLICTWPVSQAVVFSVWGSTIAVEALPLNTAVLALSGNPGPDFCATISEGQAHEPHYPRFAQQTEQVDADNAQRIAVPPYARFVQVNVEQGSTTVEANWVSETDGGVPLIRHVFFGADTANRFDGNVIVPVPPDAAWLDLTYATQGTLVNLVWEQRP